MDQRTFDLFLNIKNGVFENLNQEQLSKQSASVALHELELEGSQDCRFETSAHLGLPLVVRESGIRI